MDRRLGSFPVTVVLLCSFAMCGQLSEEDFKQDVEASFCAPTTDFALQAM